MPLPGKKPDASQAEHSPKTNWLAMVMQNWNDKHNTALKMVLIAAILGGITLSIKSAITKWDPYNASYQALEAQNAKRLAEYTQGLATLKDEHSKEVEAIHQGFQAQVDEIMEASQERLDQQSQGFQQQLEQLRSTVAEIAQKANREEGDLASRLEQWQQTMGSLQTMLREIEQQAGDQNSTFQQLSQRLASLDQQMQSAIKGSMNDEAMGLLRQMVADRLEPLIQEMQPIVQARLASNIEVIVPDIATPESNEKMGITRAIFDSVHMLYNEAAQILASSQQMTERAILRRMDNRFGKKSFRGYYYAPEEPGVQKAIVISVKHWFFDSNNNLQTTLELQLPFKLDRIGIKALGDHFSENIKRDNNGEGHVLLTLTFDNSNGFSAANANMISGIVEVFNAQEKMGEEQGGGAAYMEYVFTKEESEQLDTVFASLNAFSRFITPEERYSAYALGASLWIQSKEHRLEQLPLRPAYLTTEDFTQHLADNSNIELHPKKRTFKLSGQYDQDQESNISWNVSLTNEHNGIFVVSFLTYYKHESEEMLSDIENLLKNAFKDFDITLYDRRINQYIFVPKILAGNSDAYFEDFTPIDIRDTIANKLSLKKIGDNTMIITLTHDNGDSKTIHTVRVNKDFSLEIIDSDFSDYPAWQGNAAVQKESYDHIFGAMRKAMGG